MTLLQKRDSARRERRLALLAEVRGELRAALADILPGTRVVVFGSLTKPGVFNDRSDVDLALEQAPAGINLWTVAGQLMDRLHRPVDIVLLNKCRFRDRILREGEIWTS